MFPAWRNATRGRYLRLLVDVPRFHRQARSLLAGPEDDLEPLDAFLDRGRFSEYYAKLLADRGPIFAALVV
jgi:predicted NAD/FAD-binding protein